MTAPQNDKTYQSSSLQETFRLCVLIADQDKHPLHISLLNLRCRLYLQPLAERQTTNLIANALKQCLQFAL